MPNPHRVVIEFDAGCGAIGARLICPESGCDPATCESCGKPLGQDDCAYCKGLPPASCWLSTWFDNLVAEELLHGQVEVPIEIEWVDDQPVVRIGNEREAVR